jgi:hypothetical protein
MDIRRGPNDKISVDVKDYTDSEVASFSNFMDTSTLNGKAYIKVSVTLEIGNNPSDIIKDVLVTMRAKRLASANDYQFETYGY